MSVVSVVIEFERDCVDADFIDARTDVGVDEALGANVSVVIFDFEDNFDKLFEEDDIKLV